MDYELTPDALLHALLLDGKGGAKDLSVEHLAQWQQSDGELWVHLDYTQPGVEEWLESQASIPSVGVGVLVAEKTRPRVIKTSDESLIIVLRGVNLNQNADPEDMVSVRLFIEPGRIISSRQRRLQSVIRMIESLRNGDGPNTLAELLIELSSGLTDRIGNLVEEMDIDLESLEEELERDESKTLREQLANTRATNARLKRYLGPQRDALSQLGAIESKILSSHQRVEFFEINERLTRHIEDLDMLRERAVAAQDSIMTKLSEQLNERLYLLAIISGLFLPLGFLTGLLGVNLGGIPGADSDTAFAFFLGGLSVVTAGLVYLLKRKRWL
jgi:zinc transporter